MMVKSITQLFSCLEKKSSHARTSGPITQNFLQGATSPSYRKTSICTARLHQCIKILESVVKCWLFLTLTHYLSIYSKLSPPRELTKTESIDGVGAETRKMR